MKKYPGASIVRFVERESFREFLEELQRDDRPPLIAISLTKGSDRPAIDIATLESELGTSFPMYVLSNGATKLLTDAVTKEFSVFWGYVRIYGPFSKWRGNVHSPFISTVPARPWAKADATQSVVSSAFLQSSIDSVPRESSPDRIGEEATLEVSAVSMTQVTFKGNDRNFDGNAFTSVDEIWPGIDGPHLVKKGMRFIGILGGSSWIRSFHPHTVADDVRSRAMQWISEERVFLARIARIEDDGVVVLMHPALPLKITCGEEIRRRLKDEIGRDVSIYAIVDDGFIHADFSDENSRDSFSVLPGGPPWLDAPLRPVTPSIEEVSAAVLEAQMSAEEAAAQIADLLTRLQMSNDTIEQLQTELRALQRDVPEVFKDQEQQLRFEIQYYYLMKTPEDLRNKYVLPTHFIITSRFIESMNEFVRNGTLQRAKILERVVYTLSGLAVEKGLVKPWAKPGEGQEFRDDGSGAYRVKIQVGTPGAPRIKYWLLPTGVIELDFVGHHDKGLR